ncbi:SDR family NAD(P)-dependent oxidoreductase [Haladaptatus halobius]|uniref:SDR family NAD(P)-dependent oxidoreductase n=1 Tax=Haladaptatus halobius TaxID=2884875 RepID=UPI001D0A99A9|nr:SDR family oxidoreductase [Haladaptatus halobius]
MASQTHCPTRLEGKVAVITGSIHGIGLGIARKFATEGASIIVNDQGEYDGERVVDELDSDALYVEADVRDPAQIKELVATAVDDFGHIDVLVNNVGDGRNGPPDEVTLDDWEFTMETTLRSQWLCTKYAMEHMPRGGSIINISSANASAASPGFFPYNVAKAGVNGLTRALAIELGPLDIRVNAIEPGMIEVDNPDLSRAELEQDQKIDLS